jgi:polyisoprenoid-binding protein YceI
MKFPVICSAAALFCSTAFASPETLVVDSNHTFAHFSYSHLGFSTQQSRFNKTTGTVVYDPEARTAVVDITVDAKSVDTGSDLFNGHIQGPANLDTANFPTVTFKSTDVTFTEDTPTSVDGNLTIKGITKPVVLKITSFKHAQNPMTHTDAIGAMASGMIKRSEFNAGQFVPMVGDDVTLTISLEAQVPGAAPPK